MPESPAGDPVRLSAAEQEALVAEAARAPSVHNVQPARWRFDMNGDVVLLRCVDRALPVGDPAGHDVEVSLGAAFEGMAIALSRRGYTLGPPTMELGAPVGGNVAVARAGVGRGGEPDPLAPYVEARRSHRGRFAPAGERERAAVAALASDDLRLIDAPDAIGRIAVLHDRATWRFESQPAYHAELWSWLRLSPRDPRYHRDGLNADCLALSPLEREAARLLLRPSAFALLGRLGVAQHLITEAPQVRTATALVLFTPSRAAPAFAVGRRFYRAWLELTAAGLHAAPMSASADDRETRAALEAIGAVPPDRRLANVLRVGRAPARGVARSPRLPVEELKLDVDFAPARSTCR
jgi:hypothetical protein